MNRFTGCVALVALLFNFSVEAQAPAPSGNQQPEATLHINSRAVLVDVIVTDKSGKPVKNLPKEAFAVTEQGKPQTVQFFEEHHADQLAKPVEMPKLPQNVFSNFSPFADPPAVNVLLLDSLNTTVASQLFVHKQAMDFLKSAKPGSRTAIFAMGLGLHFVQGFNDDPAVLLAALGDKKNNSVEASVMLKGEDEGNAQNVLMNMMNASVGAGGPAQVGGASPEAIGALSGFFTEMDTSEGSQRDWITLQNLQRLARFLEGFPGRKNIIWFSEVVPSLYVTTSANGVGTLASSSPAAASEIAKTLAMLAAARAAIYPVQAGGLESYSLYTAQSNMTKGVTSANQLIGPTTMGAAAGGPAAGNGGFANNLAGQSLARNANQENAKYLAEQSGGRAFANTNGLAGIMKDLADSNSDFYTLSYAPTNSKMDGSYRTVIVKVEGNYKLSYRRGYFALDQAMPGGALEVRAEELDKMAQKNPGEVDPLLPFMDLGMPQSDQVLYEAKVNSVPLDGTEPAAEKAKVNYAVDFAVHLSDLKFIDAANGLHKGGLNISLIIYDRYGTLIARKDHRIQLDVKPDVWAVFQQDGVQLHASIAVPKGHYWLRTGIFDWGSHKVGTMEIPLDAVKTDTAQTQPAPTPQPPQQPH